MKKLLCLCLALMLTCVLSACGENKTAVFGITAEPKLTPVEGTSVSTDESEEGATTVQLAHAYGSMRLTLPAGWAYESVSYSEETGDFGLRFWPENISQGYIDFLCKDHFGVCGFDLTSENTQLENGSPVWIGKYGDGPAWSFLLFTDAPGEYVVTTFASAPWFKTYEEELMGILNSAQLGTGIHRQSEAIELAKEYCTIEYDRTRADFDYEEGFWVVEFSQSGTAGEDQTVRLNAEGVLDTEYRK